MTREPVVRELRVTDIRCMAEGCGAGPGESCRLICQIGSLPPALVLAPAGFSHRSRTKEHAELVAAGWQWQEVLP